VSSLETFFGTGNDITLGELPPAALAELQPWIARWKEGRSSTFLPRRDGSRLLWYGLTADEVQRRELQLLLRYWIGPSCSDVVVRQGALDHEDAFDRRMEVAFPGRLVRIEVWPRTDTAAEGKDSRQKVKERLHALARLMDRRPSRTHRTAPSLPVLLDELDLAATSGEPQRAFDLLDELERRRLLDAPNTTFAQIRVKALLGRHREVVASDLLSQLDGLLVPPGIVLHIARSTYEVHLRALDDEKSAAGLRQQRHDLPQVLRHVLRQGPSIDERAASVARAVMIGDEPAPAALLRKVLPQERHLQELLLAEGREAVGQPEPTEETSPDLPAVAASAGPSWSISTITPDAALLIELNRLHAARAHQALIDIAKDLERLPPEAYELLVMSAHELGDEAVAREAIAILQRELGPIRTIEWPTRLIRGAVDDLLSFVEDSVLEVDGWESWFDATASGKPTSDEVMLRAGDWTPLSADRLLELVEVVDPLPLARMLGRLRAAHEPLLDVASRGAFARKTLMMLALSDRSDADVRISGRELLSATLDAGLPATEVDEVLETVIELIRTQLSVGTLTWAIDLMVEVTGELAILSRGPLVGAWYRFLEMARLFAGAVPRSRWLEMQAVMRQVEIDLPPDILTVLEDADDPDPLLCLQSRRILLYSLHQRAARQAASRLHSVGAEVELSDAHAGSAQLDGQAQGAHLVVLVTAAAKHAATEFIEAATNGEVIYVNSAGMSAILRAMENFCMSQPRAPAAR
jgi:hypothetical protein